MRKNLLFIVLTVLSVTSLSNASNIIYVDVNGPNDPGTGSYEDPFRKIQYAINAAVDGDIIEIRPGIYTGDPNNYNLDPNGKSITIRSINPEDPNIVASTIIDPNKAGRGFYFHSGEDANCIVSGFTIRNAYTGDKGGGIFCYYSSPTITKCIISGNSADLHGGAVFCWNSNSEIIGCVISNNSAVIDGGGLECWSGEPELMNCIISDNNAVNGNGGGVDRFDVGNLTMTNCTLVRNSADSGDGLYCWGGEVTVRNSIFWANGSAQDPQIVLKPYSGTNSSVSVSYSNVEGGESAVDDPCEGLIWDSNSNINADPCFASFDPNGDPNVWDFHLRSAYGRWDPNSQDWVSDPNTSPCIDAGDPNSDWSGEPWPNGKRINVGAYGGMSQASMNGNIADFDIDGKVDFVDFAEFSNKWSAQEACIEDLHRDGVVDFYDLAIFVDTDNWLWEGE